MSPSPDIDRLHFHAPVVLRTTTITMSTRKSTRNATKRTYAEVDSSASDDNSTAPSTKPKAKRAKKNADDHDASAADSGEEEMGTTKRVPKKRGPRKLKSTKQVAPATTADKNGAPDPKWKSIRGKRGLLQEVVDFPLDILFEVCEPRSFYHAIICLTALP